MVDFLLRRPIAVVMSFIAFIILGAVTYCTLPVSLLPDIAIPKITVQVTGEGVAARELDNTVVAPVRRQLLQVGGLSDISSETRDGLGLIHLSFDFGTNTDLAFIEVNEKIDAAMSSLPKEVKRPKVIKASATDIPVFYLNMTLRADSAFTEGQEGRFFEMCNVAEQIIKRRIEQLPQIAMADVTGIPEQQIVLRPDDARMNMYGLTVRNIEQALAANNVEPGSLTIRDGYYEYNVNLSATPHTTEDLGRIFLQSNGRLLQLRDLCSIEQETVQETGRSLYAGKRAVTLAIIKQADENMDDLKRAMNSAIGGFAKQYPEIEFSISRNQTELLDYTISSLEQNLLLGSLLIFVVVFLFMGNVKSPLIIGISMAASVVITFLFFYLFAVSLNIISLSGLIMAVGMMIDNAIIVTENITQYRDRGLTLMRAAAAGTTEMILPMLSSTLTTIVVFVPLVFISGIAGALFFDEAFAVSVGLLVSYVVGILLLPVLYVIFYRIGLRHRSMPQRNRLAWLTTLSGSHGLLERAYNRGVHWTFRHQKTCLAGFFLLLIACPWCFSTIRKERMPQTTQHECMVRVAWNEPVHIDENQSRIDRLTASLAPSVKEQSAYVGTTDYLLEDNAPLETTEAELYLNVADPETLPRLKQQVSEWFASRYPAATIEFSPAETLFERLFTTSEAEVEARLHSSNKRAHEEVEGLRSMERTLSTALDLPTPTLATRPQRTLLLHRDKMLLYDISYDDLTRALKTAFKDNKVATLRSYQQYMPICIAGDDRSLEQCLQEILLEGQTDSLGHQALVPLGELATLVYGETPRTVYGAKNGEFIPYRVEQTDDAAATVACIKKELAHYPSWTVDFAGSYLSNAKMMRELIVVLAVSILLIFFILSAQFESLILPLIVLMEIPIDTGCALLLLWVSGHTINLMSAIGIIASCGIIINDSILKLDAIGALRRQGMSLMTAIHEAGLRRLRPIIMTSLTTIFAMCPLLFTGDMGSEIQRPLAIAMIGTMSVGTLVSLFFIPLIYELLNRKKA